MDSVPIWSIISIVRAWKYIYSNQKTFYASKGIECGAIGKSMKMGMSWTDISILCSSSNAILCLNYYTGRWFMDTTESDFQDEFELRLKEPRLSFITKIVVWYCKH